MGGAVVAVVATGLLFLVSTNLSGTPIPDAFYEPPGDVPSEPGVLLRSEPFAQGVPAGAEGWRILYTTTRGEDRPAVASAVIVTPIRQPDTAGFPVIAWAHGTTGYSTGCAPSLLEEPFAAGGMPALPEAIAEGWAVVATDYAGLGTAGHQPYLIGEGEGRSVLDAVRAAGQLETAQLAPSTVVWGHSQGGHAALWAGGLHPEYAPEIELDGVAAIAPASDLPEFLSAVSGSMVGGVFGSFVVEAYAAEYPDIVASDYVRPGARIALEEMSRRCLTDASTLVSVATTLAGYKPVWKGDPARGPLLERARENVPTLPVEAPLLIAQGQADDLVLLDLQRGYVDARCDEGWSLEYHTYADRDHMGVVADDSPLNADLMVWTAARLSGQPFAPGCTAHSSR